jgi:UDP-glucose:(heptosyl)LPS alpha-1,3-glucosyltransferase
MMAGHEAQLFTSAQWPVAEWPYGEVVRVDGESPLQFADELRRLRGSEICDVLMSLERVWSCDVYRAGDGVHAAWLQRRARSASAWQRVKNALNRKHAAILRLEQGLFRDRCAGRVIANSRMVKHEITQIYGYPAELIEVVPNGVPIEQFQWDEEAREASRRLLRLDGEDVAVLFVGSGWERKGLTYALQAIEKLDSRHLKFLVAGRGDMRRDGSSRAQFLGEVSDTAALYRASDIFVLPTLYDPFSNACLEALASGLPVITTTSNGFAEIIDDGVHGNTLDEPSSDSVADAITFWSDKDRRLAARPSILERAARFDISLNVARTLEILTQEASAESTSSKMRNT